MPASPDTVDSRTSLPRIHLLATGGTIAATASLDGHTRYTAGALGPEALIEAVPGIADIATLAVEQIAAVGSQNISHTIWIDLAQRVAQLQADPQVDGVVITHGTDTLEETAYFLSLVLRRDKPVVLVGAMRPAHALSADGPGNLLRAIALAGHPQAAVWGPVVIMNDSIYAAGDVQKISASGVQAFASPNGGAIGMMQGLTPVFLHAPQVAEQADPVFDITGMRAQDLPGVTIIHAYAGQDGRSIRDACVWANGIVLAGVGEGNATDEVWDAIRHAVGMGVQVIRASRCASGLVARNGEVDDDAMGTTAARLLNPAKARILLMLALRVTREPAALQRFFDQN